jgi:hypothetical protein
MCCGIRRWYEEHCNRRLADFTWNMLEASIAASQSLAITNGPPENSVVAVVAADRNTAFVDYQLEPDPPLYSFAI